MSATLRVIESEAKMHADPNSESLPTGWEAFWAIYPRHEAKKDAQKAWNSLSPADQSAAIEGAAAWRKNYLAREQHQRPLPATFLRGERWTDELPAVASTGQASHVVFDPAKPVLKGGYTPEVAALLRKLTGRA